MAFPFESSLHTQSVQLLDVTWRIEWSESATLNRIALFALHWETP